MIWLYFLLVRIKIGWFECTTKCFVINGWLCLFSRFQSSSRNLAWRFGSGRGLSESLLCQSRSLKRSGRSYIYSRRSFLDGEPEKDLNFRDRIKRNDSYPEFQRMLQRKFFPRLVNAQISLILWIIGIWLNFFIKAYHTLTVTLPLYATSIIPLGN